MTLKQILFDAEGAALTWQSLVALGLCVGYVGHAVR